jgi:hypothetical protein
VADDESQQIDTWLKRKVLELPHLEDQCCDLRDYSVEVEHLHSSNLKQLHPEV